MKRIITITAILALILTGCASDPVAYFAYSPGNPNAGEKVLFNNLSTDAESFEWSFGDGTVSSVYNPAHTFLAGGSYTVTLKAYGSRGKIDIATSTVNVIAIDPVAEFGIYTDLPGDNGPVAVETDIVFVGEQVEFYNTSSDAFSFSWNFGDGYETDESSPIYSYDTPGTYHVTLVAFGMGNEFDTYTKTLQVVEGINSALRITVLEYFDEYPVMGASVLLFGSVADWQDEVNPSEEVFTTALGKCVFEGLNWQSYYVDVWEANHDNYQLAAESIDFIRTQELEPGYIHDFIAYVDYYESEKKMTLTRIGKKKWAGDQVSMKKATELRSVKENKFSQAR